MDRSAWLLLLILLFAGFLYFVAKAGEDGWKVFLGGMWAFAAISAVGGILWSIVSALF
jgi:hypothetical protein